MNTDMNGKEVARFSHIAADGNPYTWSIGEQGITKIFLSATYHGDRDEFWIVIETDGKETGRYNCKNVSSIIWQE